MAILADRPARRYQPWTLDELECLGDNYGVLTDKTLAGRLQRSELAIRQKAYQGLHIHRFDNLWNAAELAEALCIPHSGTIIEWVKRGSIKARRSSIHRGPNRYWKFSYTGIVRCVRRHPWLVMFKPTSQWLISDYTHHFFYIVRKEWKRDPWYTTEQAARLLGVNRTNTRRYIHRGLLEAEKIPRQGGLAWVIRASAIQAFLGKGG